MIPKSERYWVIRIASGKVIYKGSKSDALREKKLAEEAMGKGQGTYKVVVH